MDLGHALKISTFPGGEQSSGEDADGQGYFEGQGGLGWGWRYTWVGKRSGI